MPQTRKSATENQCRRNGILVRYLPLLLYTISKSLLLLSLCFFFVLHQLNTALLPPSVLSRYDSFSHFDKLEVVLVMLCVWELAGLMWAWCTFSDTINTVWNRQKKSPLKPKLHAGSSTKKVEPGSVVAAMWDNLETPISYLKKHFLISFLCNLNSLFLLIVEIDKMIVAQITFQICKKLSYYKPLCIVLGLRSLQTHGSHLCLFF